jgi:hypothetical protein
LLWLLRAGRFVWDLQFINYPPTGKPILICTLIFVSFLIFTLSRIFSSVLLPFRSTESWKSKTLGEKNTD